MDYYDNVLKYNPYINLDSWKAKPSIVNLNLIKFQTNFTYKDMIEFQDEYEKRSDIYTNDTINEMNSEVKEYKSLLMGFGIGAFCSLAVTGFYFIPFFASNDCKCNCGYLLCQDITPMRRVILYSIVFSPCIILSFFSFCFTLIKKKNYNKLLTKEYIDEYKNFEFEDKKDFLESSILYNDIEFIILLITMIIIIVYPILIKLTSYIPHFYFINNVGKDTYNERPNTVNTGKINIELFNYNQAANNFKPGQYNSNNNFVNAPYYKPDGNQNPINYDAPQPVHTPYNYQYPPY